jgi:phosphoribosyl 1,2-cyclic phosphodiesterase
MLMDSETAKLKERDEKYTEQVQEWRGSLGPRKKVRYHHDEKLHHADCPYIISTVLWDVSILMITLIS